jgi:glycerol-3-phosphate dehydrogenase (NAD(P)+)
MRKGRSILATETEARPPHVAVLGAGAFGTAIATAMARAGTPVTLLCHSDAHARAIAETGENARYFPGHMLPEGITTTADLSGAIGAQFLFLAFPAKVMDDYAARIAAEGRPGAIVVNLAKGLHAEHFTFAELFRRVAPTTRYVALKGPTFARPLFLGEWSGMTCGAEDPAVVDAVIALFGKAAIAFDRSASPDTVDIASALKNVYAITLGLVGSTGPSENTVYLAVTLVLREMRAILAGLGLDEGVMLSFAGVGDTLLTGLCDTSRNRTLGLMLGKGLTIDPARSDFLTEGVRAVETLRAHLHGIDAPFLKAVADVLAGRETPTHVFEVIGLR